MQIKFGIDFSINRGNGSNKLVRPYSRKTNQFIDTTKEQFDSTCAKLTSKGSQIKDDILGSEAYDKFRTSTINGLDAVKSKLENSTNDLDESEKIRKRKRQKINM